MQPLIKGVRFEQESDIDPRFFIADKEKRNEIFLNLVSDAYKYTPDVGAYELHSDDGMILSGAEDGVAALNAVAFSGQGCNNLILWEMQRIRKPQERAAG